MLKCALTVVEFGIKDRKIYLFFILRDILNNLKIATVVLYTRVVILLTFVVKYWLEIAFGLIITMLSYTFKKLISYKKTLDDTKYGVRVILKNTIIEKYNELIKKDNISIFDKKVLVDMYDAYKNLGGNSFIKDLIEKINQLDVVD